MTSAMDTDNRVVVHFPIWVRVLGGIGSLGFGALSYGLAQDIGEDTASLVLFLCVGLSLTFLSIYFLGYTSQFIFDQTTENMTIRTGVGPFTYRNRTFSKKQILTVGTYVDTAEAVSLWGVSIKISGKKRKIKIIADNKKMAIYLYGRIRAFL